MTRLANGIKDEIVKIEKRDKVEAAAKAQAEQAGLDEAGVAAAVEEAVAALTASASESEPEPEPEAEGGAAAAAGGGGGGADSSSHEAETVPTVHFAGACGDNRTCAHQICR